MKIQDLKELIDFISQKNLGKVTLKTKEIDISVENHQVMPAHQLAYQATMERIPNKMVEEEAKMLPSNDHLQTIQSPLVGVFYNVPKPGEPPFVKLGDKVKKGDIVGIIEAMKLFNNIEASHSGIIEEILVENEEPVEYDQPLFRIKLQ